ncbi:SprT-like family-domain-containing protein [Sparassis latifolia]
MSGYGETPDHRFTRPRRWFGAHIVRQVEKDEDMDEIIPDSEEERIKQRRMKADKLKIANEGEVDVFVIPSDEDEKMPDVPQWEPIVDRFNPHTKNGNTTDSSSDNPQPVAATPRRRNPQTPRARRIILSSSSEVSDSEAEALLPAPLREPRFRTTHKPTGEVIDLTSGSSEDSDHGLPKHVEVVRVPKTKRRAVRPTPAAEQKAFFPLYVDDDGEEEANMDDGSILILDEPRSAHKPIRKTPPSAPGINTVAAGPSTSLTSATRGSDVDSTNDDTPLTAYRTPASSRTIVSPAVSTPTGKGARPPRLTKKALQAAEQAHRETYAQAFFDELNRVVFQGRIPQDTQLRWNKRLLTTAGRAKWHKSRDGVQTAQIELAVKILDCNERIRNTLSHEMCHLACWIINKDPKEGHGQIFKEWADKVMSARPDILVTTKHSYEITYKYEWKCEKCDKIYGRHSKSINPDECVCGSCKVGKLIPLFETAQRAPKTPKTKADSQQASTKSRDSPIVLMSPIIDLTIDSVEQETPTRARRWEGAGRPKSILRAHASDDEADVTELVHIMGVVSIGNNGSA